MVEVTMATLLVGGMLVTSLNLLGSVYQTQQRNATRSTGPGLAHELLSEVMAMPYYDADGLHDIVGVTREGFDNIYDYQDWDSAGAVAKDGTALPNYTDWSRKVNIFTIERDTGAIGAAEEAEEAVELVEASDEVLTGVSIKSNSSEDESNNRLAVMCIDGSGFDEATGLHGNFPNGTMWLNKGTPNDPLPAGITFDLGADYDLNSLMVWNYNESGAFTERGVKMVEILVKASDASGYTSLGDFVFMKATGLTDYAGQAVDLSSFAVADSTRYVQFNIKSNWDDANQLVGLSELRFYGHTDTSSRQTNGKGVYLIVVTVTDPDDNESKVQGLRSGQGALEQSPGVDTEVVTWIGAELQLGSSPTVARQGTALTNQATDTP